jgi:hypothetical protein
MKTLRKRKAELSYYNPFIPEIYNPRQTDLVMSSVKLTEKILKEQGGVIITAAHSNVAYKKVIESSSIIVDTQIALFGIKKVYI